MSGSCDNMECDRCPVWAECRSARGVAIRSCGDDIDKTVRKKINMVCPIEELLYTTFLIAIHNAQNVIVDGGAK